MLERIQIPAHQVDESAVERLLQRVIDPDARVAAVRGLAVFSESTVLLVELAGGRRLVCKLRHGGESAAFEREAYQLSYLADRVGLEVPEVLATGRADEIGPSTCYMIRGCLDGVPWERFLALSRPRDREPAERQLGEALGRMHAELTSLQFHEILPDASREYSHWSELFRSLWDSRVESVLASDRLDSVTVEAVEGIHQNLAALLTFDDRPRLIHGHLTASSVLCRQGSGGWAIAGFLDPVLCYGHHEVDLALVEYRLRASPAFFDAYRERMPIHEGYELRKYVYMLYSVLEDVGLFGNTHHILGAIELTREILQRCGL